MLGTIRVLHLLALGLFALLVATDSGGEGVRSEHTPWGIRLRWAGSSATAPLGIDRRMITWQMTISEVESLLGEKDYINRRGEGLWFVGGEENGNWYADLGGSSPRDYPTVLYFIDSRFYRYTVDIPPSRFGEIERALRGASGEPTDESSSVVRNRMNAEFDQETRAWDLGEVEIYLAKRGSRVDAGVLTVTFLPLARTVPEASATAPF